MALYTPEYKPNGKEIAVITTDEGTIRVQLHGEDAPIHVGNFVELAQKGFYDGLKFHRYVPGFVIQGGCPNTREMSAADVAALIRETREQDRTLVRLWVDGDADAFSRSILDDWDAICRQAGYQGGIRLIPPNTSEILFSLS